LPQIEKYPESIELIISDNASTDNTIEVIQARLKGYSSFSYLLFKQKENTGVFGNFHKCISLGTGKYFWLLSDYDYVFAGVVDVLIECLKKEDIGAIFLNNWSNDKNSNESFKCKYVNKINFFKDRPFRHSLISSIIYAHTVHENDEVFESLKGNALIGYAVYLKAIRKYDKFAILTGNSLMARNNKEDRYNALWIFTVDLAACIKLAKDYYPNKITNKIANSFLITNTLIHYTNFKFYQKFDFERNKSLMIFNDYLKYREFWFKISPLIVYPKYLFLKLKHFRNILHPKN
jgi:glycosyltransferase involved in cell wall biosynthesis